METISGSFKCKSNCSHTVQLKSYENKNQARSSIRAHCIKCYPNVREALYAHKFEARKKDPSKYNNMRNKSKAKRNLEVEEDENKAKS